MELFKAKSSTGKVVFYIFEICALIVGIFSLTMAIYNSAKTESFMVFLNGTIPMIVNTLLLYGIGRIIDLHYAKQ